MLIRLALIVVLSCAALGRACTYCNPSNANLQTFRQEARTSKFVVIGTLTSAAVI